MRLVDRKAVVRIAIALVVVGSVMLFMCRCWGKGKRIMEPPKIPADALRAHVEKLAGELGEHNVFCATQLHRAADYIERVWRDQAYEVTRYPYEVYNVECANLEVTRQGKTRPSEIILVGAHYDSVAGSPGANDNGSGVAAMLELSRFFANRDPARTIRFVAFVNEEPPFFQTPQMGSRVYAKMAKTRGDDIRGMICLETMGYYSDQRGGQRYPFPFNLFYPNRGNFIGFVSNLRSRSVMHRAVRAFRAHSDFPVECCATWGRIPGVDWSDHASFWREGYPSFMVTDTAPYRYPDYHTAQDTPEKIDYDSLARVTEGLCGTIASLAAE
jgi:hypothetical protein